MIYPDIYNQTNKVVYSTLCSSVYKFREQTEVGKGAIFDDRADERFRAVVE
jgi:hypothetical protein